MTVIPHAVKPGSIPAVGRMLAQLCGTVLYICIYVHSSVVTAVKGCTYAFG